LIPADTAAFLNSFDAEFTSILHTGTSQAIETNLFV
jgi:hypothetical protein